MGVSAAGFSCAPELMEDDRIPKEVVISPDESVRISNPSGTILIEWSGLAGRDFTYKEYMWRERMTVREERW